jgi:prophage regulatory protein
MPDTFLKRDEILARIPFSSSHLYRLEAAGEFPARVQIGRRKVAYLESEITSWIEAKVKSR